MSHGPDTSDVLPDQEELLDLVRGQGEAAVVSVRPGRLEFGDLETTDAVDSVGSGWVLSRSSRGEPFVPVLSTPDVAYVQRSLVESTIRSTRRALGYPFPWLPVEAEGVAPGFVLDVDRDTSRVTLTDARAGSVVAFGGGASVMRAVQASWTSRVTWRELLILAGRRDGARELGVPADLV